MAEDVLPTSCAAVCCEAPGIGQFAITRPVTQLKPLCCVLQVPKRIEFVDALPRNAMGKINKKEVLRDFFS